MAAFSGQLVISVAFLKTKTVQIIQLIYCQGRGEEKAEERGWERQREKEREREVQEGRGMYRVFNNEGPELFAYISG